MEVVSGIGDGVFWVGLVAVLLEKGVGVNGFAAAALVRLGPRAIGSAPAGVLVDRIDRRRLLVGLDLARAITMVALAAAWAAGASVTLLLAIVLVTYTLAAPYRPALTAALPLVAGEAGLSSANALVSTIRQVMTFVGPVVGAAVISWCSPTVAFGVNAVSFVIAAALMSRIPELAGRPSTGTLHLARHRADWSREVAGGWSSVRATPGLGVITLLVLVMYAARGAELLLYPLVAEQQLGLGPAGVGVLTGAAGLGAICALPAVRYIADSNRHDVMLTTSVAATALPIALLSAVHSPVVACIALFLVGAGVVVFEVVSVMLLLRLASKEVLGRVFGLIGTASNSGKLFGALVVPALVLSMDLPGALVASGLVVAAVGAATVPGLVSLTRTTRVRREQLAPLVEVLAGVGAFEDASRFALERVAIALTTEHVDAGAVVIRQGDLADDMFVVRSGEFVVIDGDRQINEMGPGDWFGEIGLLQHRRRTASVIATTDAVLWRIPGDVFLSALSEGAAEPAALLDVMADRLARSNQAGA